ncbi:hypothetical protein GW17_00000982 [Ensete ventricosum]|nr:hypothetical protein GW17_00000982 [Ensete ventricosum]
MWDPQLVTNGRRPFKVWWLGRYWSRARHVLWPLSTDRGILGSPHHDRSLVKSFSPSSLSLFFDQAAMEGHSDFRDWEMLLAPEAGEDIKPLQASEDDSEDGAIKSDYFALESQLRYQKGASFTLEGEEEEEEAQVDSDNPSWIDPESDSRYLDRPKGEVGFPVIEFRRKDLGGLWSDESSDGQRSLFGSEKEGFGAGGLETGERADGEEDVKAAGVEGIVGIEGTEMGHENPDEVGSDGRAKTDECYSSPVEMGDKNVRSGSVLNGEREKKGMVWWKFPFEILKFCAFKVKPVWSISIAVAILGVFMLRKRLYRMKQKTISIPLKVSMDEKVKFLVSISLLNQ